ncbi:MULTISPECIES: hypothetical protein [Hyphomicrobiales]|jgi:hypothetical protein|nr:MULTISPECIES: hypothetical protein [Phyllobacteriaceae]
MISPVFQSFRIAEGPEGGETGIGLNFSSMRVGVGSERHWVA